jgi:hypothetical protein
VGGAAGAAQALSAKAKLTSQPIPVMRQKFVRDIWSSPV